MATKIIVCAVCGNSFSIETKRGGYPNTCSDDCRQVQRDQKVRRYEKKNRQRINSRAVTYRSTNKDVISERERARYAVDPTKKRNLAISHYLKIKVDPDKKNQRNKQHRNLYVRNQLIATFEKLNGRSPTADEIQIMTGH